MAKTLEVALKDFPSEILQEVKDLESSVAALLAPPFKLSEVFAIMEDAGNIILKSEGITKSEAKQALNDIWSYFNDRYKILEFADSQINLPGLLEPFDAMLIGLIVTSIIIPSIVGLLKLPE